MYACGDSPDCEEFVPTLNEEGKYVYDISIDFNNYFIGGLEYSIDGYEIYEKNGDEYLNIRERECGTPLIVEVLPGERKIYIARAFVYNSNSEKIYSDYSNELEIDHSNS